MTTTTETPPNAKPPAELPTRYTDKLGRTWETRVDPFVADRLDNECGFDIDGMVGGAVARELGTKPRNALALLWCIVQRQADDRTLDRDAWLKGLGAGDEDDDGEAMGRALDALVGGLIAFFPQPEMRRFLTATYRTLPEMADTMGEAVQTISKQAQTAIRDTASQNPVKTRDDNRPPAGQRGNSPDAWASTPKV